MPSTVRKPKVITMEQIIDSNVDGIIKSKSRTEISLRTEAERIVRQVQATQPKLLLEWLQDVAVDLVRQRLQVALAGARRASRRGVFDSYDEKPEQRREVYDPFGIRYATENNIWKRLGDMTRTDWQYVVNDRTSDATASLFDIALGARVIKKLPDDATKTQEVLSTEELRDLENEAQEQAINALTQFRL